MATVAMSTPKLVNPDMQLVCALQIFLTFHSVYLMCCACMVLADIGIQQA